MPWQRREIQLHRKCRTEGALRFGRSQINSFFAVIAPLGEGRDIFTDLIRHISRILSRAKRHYEDFYLHGRMKRARTLCGSIFRLVSHGTTATVVCCPLSERVSVGDGAQSISPPSHNSERMATSSKPAVPGGRVPAAVPVLRLSFPSHRSLYRAKTSHFLQFRPHCHIAYPR